MRQIISDIVKHTGGLGFIEIVKVTGTKDETKVEAMDNDKTVIIKGALHSPVSEFEGEFGLTNLSLVKGLVDHPNFKADGATIEVIREINPSDDTEVPTEMIFTDNQSQTASYRFMSSQLVPSQAKFLGTAWDVSVSPSKSKIAEFASFASLYSSFENLFMVETRKGELRFNIGDQNGASHKTSIVMAKDVTGTMASGLYWPIAQVLSILKLSSEEEVTLNFSSKGALQISINSDTGRYDYILPAKKR